MISKLEFHHIGVATTKISESLKKYVLIGYVLDGEIFEDNIQNVKVCFLSKAHSPLVELVEPLNQYSPVKNILKKAGTTPYHICYVVENILESVDELKKEEFILLSKPVEAIAFKNKKICFLYNTEIGLIELVEK